MSTFDDPPTPEELAEAMKGASGDDYEIAHCRMDDLMEGALRSLGYGAAMDVFKEQPKWYA